jgi:CBS domain-containing protein
MQPTPTETKRYVVNLMTPDPVVVGVETPVWQAALLAAERNVHHLLVVDQYHLVGVICCCDLLRAGVDDEVGWHHHSPAVTVEDQETATAAYDAMQTNHVGCLPVVDWCGTLHGVLTRGDLRNAGLIACESDRHCATCGSTHGLPEGVPGASLFCMVCLGQGAMGRNIMDEIYLANGGRG